MIEIRKSPTADTRTCDFSGVSKETLLASSKQHIEDVKIVSYFLAAELVKNARIHDADKIEDIDTFHQDFLTGFETHEWWDKHKNNQKHHLIEECVGFNDVNLLDILENIIDCVVAGLARSGSLYPINVKSEILELAVQNTVKMLVKNIKVVE